MLGDTVLSTSQTASLYLLPASLALSKHVLLLEKDRTIILMITVFLASRAQEIDVMYGAAARPGEKKRGERLFFSC